MGNNFKAVASIIIPSAKAGDFRAKAIDNATRKKMNKSILARSIHISTTGDKSAPTTREAVMLLAVGKIMTTPARKERMIPNPSKTVWDLLRPTEYRLCHILG